MKISQAALIGRINRKLAKEDRRLHKLRGDRDLHNFGRYYTVELSRNIIDMTDVDPVELGRELGVLRDRDTINS